MGDGSKVGKGLKFCKNCFLVEDLKILQSALEKRYQLPTTIQSAGAPNQ